MIVTTPIIEWTPQKLTQLKRAQKAAEANKLEGFKIWGEYFDTTYAKYLVEYMDIVFKKKGIKRKYTKRKQ